MNDDRFFFKDVEIFDGYSFYKGSVYSENGKIKEIGEDITLSDVDAEVISGDFLVMPGMVNAHTHVPMSLFKGAAEDLPLDKWLNNAIFPLESKFISAQMCYLAGLWSMIEMVRNGITSFVDMYFFSEDIGRAAKEIGMKAFIGEGIINFPSPAGKMPDESIEYVEYVAKKYHDDPNIFTTVSPHSPYLTDEKYLLRLNDISEKYKIPYHIHMAETKGEIDNFKEKTGSTPFVHFDNIGLLSERFLAAHSVWVSDYEIDIMAKRGITIAHCPGSNMKLGSGVAPVSKMIEKGVNVQIGTDGSASNNSLDLLREVELAAKLQKGTSFDPSRFKAIDAMKSITSNSSKILGAGFGELKQGQAADMVLVDLSQISPIFNYDASLVYAATGKDVHSVFINGKRVVNNGNIETIDVGSIQKEFYKLVVKVREFLSDL